MRKVIEDIISERTRQKVREGWTSEHDDKYVGGELAAAAGCYALESRKNGARFELWPLWPWAGKWWKPSTPRRDLVKAGALIVAELERLDRMAR
jgi:hypothetical protein